MALPAGITPKTVTVGIPTFTVGGRPATGSATLIAATNLVHVPTGTPLFSGRLTKQFKGLTQVEFTDLVPTDDPGLNRFDWTYRLEVRINGAEEQPDPINFELTAAGPDVVDSDLLVEVPSSAGTPVFALAVRSIAGLEGDVTAAQLATALNASGNRLSDVALRAAFVSLDGFVFDPLKYGAVGDGVADDTTAVKAAVAAARAVHGMVVFRRMFLVNDTIVQDDNFGLVGVGRNVGLKAGSGMPSGAPLLWTKRTTGTGGSTAVIEGHMYGAKVDGIRLDGNARTVACKGWQIDVVTNCDFRNVDIRHFAQEGMTLTDSMRESDWYHVHVRGCGDAANGYPAVSMNHSTTKDGHNNLHFYGLYSIFSYGVALQIKPTDDTSPVRNIQFYSPMFHGMIPTATAQDDLTITPDWRHLATPLVEVADARTVNMVNPRLHRSGNGQPLVLMRNNEGTATTENSVTLLAPVFGTSQAATGTVTATAATDRLSSTGIKLGTGAMVRFTSTGTLPAGLSLATDYYAIRVDDDTFKVATSRALAEAGTAVDITDTGSGTHTVTTQDISVLLEPSNVGTLRVVAPILTDDTPSRGVVVNKGGNNKVTIEAVTPAAGVTFFEPFSASDYPVVIPGAINAQGAAFAGAVAVTGGDVVLDNGKNLVGKTTGGTQVQIAKVTPSDTVSLGNPGGNAATPTTEVKAVTTLNLTAAGATHRANASGFAVASSAWDGAHLLVGSSHLWIDAAGNLRLKGSAPASDTDGAAWGALTAMRTSDAAAVNNSTVLTTSTVLTLNLDAAATYAFDGLIHYDCTTAADLKIGWSVPASATGFWTPDGLHTSVTSNSGTIQRLRSDLATASAVGGAGVGTTVSARVSGTITTVGAGAFAFRYAQNTADATDLIIRSGSYLTARRIA